MRTSEFYKYPLIVISYVTICFIVQFFAPMINQASAGSPDIKEETVTVPDWLQRYRHIDPKTGYRTAYYRAALPKSVPGGTRINLEQAKAHFNNKTALFLDVMAHTGTGPDPIDGHWRLSETRQNIPGSTWLADVGTGTLTPAMEEYYRTNLEKLTKGDKTKPLIIYCTADCWMAWNAVRRAANWGYSNLLWFPEGSDDWAAADLPMHGAIPLPLTIEDDE